MYLYTAAARSTGESIIRILSRSQAGQVLIFKQCMVSLALRVDVVAYGARCGEEYLPEKAVSAKHVFFFVLLGRL